MLKRGKTLFNDNWQFTLTPPDSEMKALKNVHWYDVEIPHDWLIYDTSKLYESGCGWYRKTLSIEKEELDSCFILCFDGVYMDTTLYINGKQAGEWKYGYTAFSFDISEYLKEGDNEILVRVNHKSPNTRWYSGAGIFRNVHIRKTSKNHIAENGIYIHTKRNYSKADRYATWKIVIQTELSRETVGTISYEIENKYGEVMLSAVKKICDDRERTSIYTDFLKPWNPGFPNLYTLRARLYDEQGELLDEMAVRFGLKSVQYDPNCGLMINGIKCNIHGVCLHHDLGALGAAFNRDAAERQLKIMLDMGVNAIRTSHNPPAREFMELCDEMGILVNSEFVDMWESPKNEYDYARFFNDWYKKDVEAWIKRDRNSPSVIMWSIGNEIHDTHKSERGLEIAKMLVEEVERYDPSHNARATIASNYMAWENAQKVADFIKIAGYNYAEWLYDEHHKAHPDWCIYGSETASTVRSRGIYHFPAEVPQLSHDDMQCSELSNSVVGWGATPEKSVTMDRDRKFCMGQFVWTGFDYIGEPTPYNTKNSYFGIVDTAGFPKESYWFYKSMWHVGGKPFIHIGSNWDYNEDQMIDIIAYSNLPVLVLTYKGDEYPPVTIDHEHGEMPRAMWKIPYDERKVIFIRGYEKVGEEEPTLTVTMVNALDPKDIVLKCDKKEITADGRSLAFVEISTKDHLNLFVPNANNRIKVTVTGNARLVGLDNGDSTDYDSYKGSNRRLFSGKLLAIVESTLNPGKITVTAESPGLNPAKLVLKSVAPEYEVEGISVVTKNQFPYPKKNMNKEIPIRKLELKAPIPYELNENNKTAEVKVIVHPENATFNDIGFKCVADNGVEVSFARVLSFENNTALIEAKGDGRFRLRAYAKNGKPHPDVISELEYTASGLGSAVKNPYIFNAGCLYDFGSKTLNTIERGALGSFEGRTVIGFSDVDFGLQGTDRIIISLGNSGGGEAYPVSLYEGNADKGGRLIGTFDVAFNGGWDRAYPEEFALPETLKGIKDISFVIDRNCIFGGFEFVRVERAYKKNYAADCDKVYGDSFEVCERAIEKIGNNVVIEFNEMNFNKGADNITIKARTPLNFCTVQLRLTDKNGKSTVQILEFPHADEYTKVKFNIDKMSGVYDVSFVFLPGTKFDMDSFTFGKE